MRYRHIFVATLLGTAVFSAGAGSPATPTADNFYHRATDMYETGNYTGAIDQLHRYLQISPAEPMGSLSEKEQAALLLLKAMLKRGELDNVHRDVEEYKVRYAGSMLIPEAEMADADAFYFNGDYGKAVSIYETLPLSTFESTAGTESYFHYAVALGKTGHFNRAKEIFYSLEDDPVWGAKARFYVAYLAYVDRDYVNALTLFRALSPDVASEMGADFYIGQTLFAQGNYPGVIAMKDSMLAAAGKIDSKETPALSEAWRVLGESYYATGDHDNAGKALRTYISREGRGTDSARYILGVMAYDNGDFQEADAWFSPVAGSQDAYGQSALLYLGQSAGRRGDYTGAAIYFDRAAAMPYDDKVAETALYDYAAAVISGGKVPFGSASGLLEDFGKRYPGSKYTADVNRYLARGYFSENRYLKALQKLEQIKNPDAQTRSLMRKALYELGVSEMAAGQPVQAEYYLLRALENAPSDEISSASRLWLAESYYEQKEYTKAVAAYKKYLGAAPKNDVNRALALYDMAYAFYQLGDYRECRKAMEDAVAVKGAAALSSHLRTDAILRMADCDNYMGNVSQALKTYNLAVEDAESSSPDYAALQAACMHGILGDYTSKKQGLETMLKKWPDSPWTQQALYELSQAALATGNFDDALQAQKRLKAIAPGSQLLRESKLQTAEAYFEAGKENEGVKCYKDLITEWPTSSQALTAGAALEAYCSSHFMLNDYLTFISLVPGARLPQPSEMDRLTYINAIAGLEKDEHNAAPFEDYVASYPDGHYLPDALLVLTQIYRDTRNSDKALATADRLLTNFPDCDAALPVLQIKGEILQSKGDNDAASLVFATLLSKGEADYTPAALRGLIATASTPQDAVDYADKLLALGTLSADELTEAQFIKADALLNAGRPAEAVTLLKSLIRDTGSSQGGKAVVKIANIYLKQGQPREAQKLMLDFTNKGCDDLDQLALGYIALADSYTALGDKQRAKRYLEALATNYPGDNKEIVTLINNRLKQ